jgi:uracil-DNA glycosylase family 4
MNKGFFTLEQTMITRGDETIKNHVKKVPVFNCTKCGLSNTCNSPKMEPSGEGRLNILVIAEAPGPTEDSKGTQLVGQSGQLLRNILQEIDLDLDRDFYKTNAITCFPGRDKTGKINTPKPMQVLACRKNLLQTIERYKPKVIIPLGKIAMDALVQHKISGRLSGLSMTDWNGCSIPDQEYKCYICPTWHPSFLLRQNSNESNETDPVLVRQVQNVFLQAIELSKQKFHTIDYTKNCYTFTEASEAINILIDAKHWPTFAFDYETTGLKPFRKGHELYSVSLSNGAFSYSFPFFNDGKFRSLWKELLLNKEQIKIAHNKKMEALWTKVLLKYWPKIQVDTMLNARAIHNGKKVNLKFLTYSKFGITYADEIEPFLESDTKERELYGANAFNRIKQAPLDKLLLYGALDSLFTHKIYELQQSELDEHTTKGAKFFNSAMNELSRVEYAGVQFNTETAKEEFENISTMMKEYEIKVNKMKEMKLWDKSKVFSFTAPQDLAYLLFDKMGVESKNKTATGKNSSDVDSLEQFKNKYPIVNIVLEWRKLKKIRDTYLKGFMREATDGVIHTTLNLHIADSLRSSSDSPNLQNVPAHNEFAMNTIRRNIVPSRNRRLIEFDYKALEANIIGDINHDPAWIEYMTNPKSDMHRDMAAKLYLRKKSEVSKAERYLGKNGFVFPTIYQSYWKNTATNLWDCDKDTKQHLKNSGFKTLDDYRKHVKSIEDWFWNEQFPVARDWSKQTIKDYEEKGYIDLVTGFRCWGPMSRNEVINKQVQGPASHCKLWTLEQVSKEITKRKMVSKIVLEIHDSILIDTDPSEEDYIDYLLWLYGTQKIMEHWNWLIIPLQIEKKITTINGDWAHTEEIGIIKGE